MPSDVNNDGMTVVKAVVFSANLIKVLRAFAGLKLYFKEPGLGVNSNLGNVKRMARYLFNIHPFGLVDVRDC